jgi:uncharacterized protein
VVESAPNQIERGQTALREMGFPQARVHTHGNVVRIELPEEDLARALESPQREEITAAFKALGFLYVTLDLD